MRTVVLGMGNELLSDDGVGIEVARRLRELITDPAVEIRETSLAGLELIDLLAGFERAIIIDSIATGAQPGSVHVLSAADLDSGAPPSTLHHVDLPTVLAMARRLGIEMPDEVTVFAVEARDVSTFGGGCCIEVETAAARVVATIARRLRAASAADAIPNGGMPTHRVDPSILADESARGCSIKSTSTAAQSGLTRPLSDTCASVLRPSTS